MSSTEMKWKITSSLDNLSDDKLNLLLGMIERGENAPAKISYDINVHLDQVLHEDANLLKRLA